MRKRNEFLQIADFLMTEADEAIIINMAAFTSRFVLTWKLKPRNEVTLVQFQSAKQMTKMLTNSS